MADLKKMYSSILGDSFPMEMTISFGDQQLVYKKKTWKIPLEDGTFDERGVRYGENPDQEAALYELVNGNLTLGDCHFIEPGNGLVSAITVEDMLQVGKHPGKINLTDIDNGLNIIKYLMDKPASVILKHNNPCGAAYGDDLATAFNRALRADRIAAFGGAVVLNRTCDIDTAELLVNNYLEVVCAPEFADGTLEILKKTKEFTHHKNRRYQPPGRIREIPLCRFQELDRRRYYCPAISGQFDPQYRQPYPGNRQMERTGIQL